MHRFASVSTEMVLCCTLGLCELTLSTWSRLITPDWGKQIAHIVKLNATTLKNIHCFPAEYAHLLHSEIFNLDELKLEGRLPEGSSTVCNILSFGTLGFVACWSCPSKFVCSELWC